MIDPLPALFPASFVLRAGLGALLGGLIGAGGRWRGALTTGGAIAATFVGGVVFTFGGWAWAVLIVAFFISSSLLSVYQSSQKETLAQELLAKDAQRDVWQVLANGGWLTLLALVTYLRPEWRGPWLLPAAVGTMAAATADTWATELGLLSQIPPRLITTGESVPPGTNGAVTRIGTFSAITGGLFIGFLAGILAFVIGAELPFSPGWLTVIGGLSGLGGALFDSVLGATVQYVNWCPTCKRETEADVHHCGTATQPHRGWSWLDNDMVNFLASIVGSVVAMLLAFGLSAM